MKQRHLNHRCDTNLDDETTLVITILSLIDGGFSEGQNALAETAARQCGLPVQCALSVLRRYTGADCRDHYWKARSANRGRLSYELLRPNRSAAEA